MKKKVRLALALVLAGVFAVSLGMLARELLQYRQGEETYDEAQELAVVPDLSEIAEPDSSADSSAAAGSAAAVYVDPYADALRNMRSR